MNHLASPKRTQRCVLATALAFSLSVPSVQADYTGSLNAAREEHAATLLPDGTVLVTGGDNFFAGGILSSAEIYHPTSGTWSPYPAAALRTPRREHTATLLPNGTVLIAGGVNGYNDTPPFASAELFDPDTGSWSTTGSLSAGRSGHTATLLPNGKVLVAGGQHADGGSQSAELYDPATGSWSPAGDLVDSRDGHTSTLLPNGTVFAMGGSSDYNKGSADFYDPATGLWSSTTLMPVDLDRQTATLLPNSTVLFTGGLAGRGPTAAVIYDPATRSWRSTGFLRTGRICHTATLLADGRVLIAGGSNGFATATAEIHDPNFLPPAPAYEKIFWSGDVATCDSTDFPDVGSYWSPNWYVGHPPYSTQEAVFSLGPDPILIFPVISRNGLSTISAAPHSICFGDVFFEANDLCTGDHLQFGGSATAGALNIATGAWTFSFTSYTKDDTIPFLDFGSVNEAPFNVAGRTIVNFDPPPDFYSSGPSKLTLRKGRMTSGSVLVGDSSFGGSLSGLGGILELEADATLASILIEVAEYGKLTGSGTLIGQVVNRGYVAPGLSPGKLTIMGEYDQRGEGVLVMEIGGKLPGIEHDVLEVTGNATIDGVVQLQFIDGFAPKQGDVFKFLKPAPTSTGSFSRVEIAGLAPGFQYAVTQNGADYSLTALTDGIATSLPVLTFEVVGDQVVLSWPETAKGFSLQRSTDLGADTWQILPTTDHRLTIPRTGTQEFFRLKRP